MAGSSPTLSDHARAFINRQMLFFVATAAPDGRVNVSPKGLDTLRVLAPDRLVWLSLSGSGNETAAHLLESDRMTLMFCAFDGKPGIVRIYGHAKTYHPRDAQWPELSPLFPISGGRSTDSRSGDRSRHDILRYRYPCFLVPARPRHNGTHTVL